ncbi:MFS transporter, partial [Bordetella petrii]|uniref:MFS transporter n=1 Tax=Bordetella petrii TaxID=94624 RepID=UPI001E401439
APAGAAGHANAAFGPRLATGLVGIFIAAMVSGINNRVGALALADIRGAAGFALDDATWLTTAYTAGELVAMPLATWFAITVSLRRFHVMMLVAASTIACVLPMIHSMDLLVLMRGLQGLFSGALIPLLMAAALRFFPPSIRLVALALYSMTATFSPNVSAWLVGLWTDQLADMRMLYWQIIPVNLLAGLLVAWGIPRDPAHPQRYGQANWFGFCFGGVGLALLAIGLEQGNRLEWFASPLVCSSLAAGALLVAFYLYTEWHHPAPFIKPQLLGRRNLGLGFFIFFCLLTVFLSGSLLPMTHLGHAWGHRALQSAPIGLLVGLPQLVIAPAIALLLYRKWVDARVVMALGLGLVALACMLAARLTNQWMWPEFVLAQSLQAVGQPMAVIAMLFLATSVVAPEESPYIAGTVNLIRALGAPFGAALVARVIELRTRYHSEMLLDHAARAEVLPPPDLAARIAGESAVLSTADAFRLLALLATALIPLALSLNHIPSPRAAANSGN